MRMMDNSLWCHNGDRGDSKILNDGDDFKILRGKKGNSQECENHQNKIIFSLPSELSPVLLQNIHKAG